MLICNIVNLWNPPAEYPVLWAGYSTSIWNQSFSSMATFYGLKYASTGWTKLFVYSVSYSLQLRLYPSRVHPSRRSSSILKSLRCAEVTNQYDIINNTPKTPIIFMPNYCSDWSPRRRSPPACSSGRSGSPWSCLLIDSSQTHIRELRSFSRA